MVAYSFKRQFVPDIRSGKKIGTIRALGKRRHARPGEMVQLYCEMRRPTCFKIMPDVRCTRVNEIEFMVDRDPKRIRLLSNGVPIKGKERDRFAQKDGFGSFDEMVLFWIFEHGEGLFRGVHILWR